MTPTLIPGDRIWVNKLIFGGRIYKEFDFNMDAPLKSWRMPRLRVIQPNDVLVFNAPHGYDRGKIEFKINYVYAKRCIGTPGDTISIQNCRFYNNNYDKVLGDTIQQNFLESIPDSLIPSSVMRVFPADEQHKDWTIKNMGPLYVPQKGDSICIDKMNWGLYRLAIEYETRSELSFLNDQVLLDGRPLSYYKFTENYYYFCGDNVADSRDSRYLGFVPEEFIVGVVGIIPYSRDRASNKIRWDRICKSVKVQ